MAKVTRNENMKIFVRPKMILCPFCWYRWKVFTNGNALFLQVFRSICLSHVIH